ncbi:MAG: TonB-dependent receptor [Balneolaceae bacterium]|nr:TonB-dependent receptor [Balneolaceae bacterium]
MYIGKIFSLLTLFLFFLLMIAAENLFAQKYSVSGTVYSVEEESRETLQGANVMIFELPDSISIGGTSTTENGEFRIINIPSGDYYLRISFLGFSDISKIVQIESENVSGLEFELAPSDYLLEDLEVVARRPRVEVRGDTTAFHAGGYQTNRDASVQDLVTRMPGFMIEDGNIVAQGEEVMSVLVDGEEFFGEDAALTLRNLPAEIVEQIEVYDRESDQAQFTGFRDGDTRRTINIVTKDGMNNGQFGRANSGYGSQTRYMAGGNYNYFNGSQRLSFVGMSNNVNQQNFSSEDLLGISEAAGSGGGGRGGNRTERNFRVGNQSGISAVNSAGVNYNDRWNDSWRVNASYFFNMADNTHDLNRERLYLSGFSADQRYDEVARNTSDNYNHRFDMRMEHTIDDRRSFIFAPRISAQSNSSFRTVDGFTLDHNRLLMNEILRENSSDQTAYNVSGFMLYRHRFETRGRTFSANLRTNLSDRSGERFQFDESTHYDETDQVLINNQRTDIVTGGYRLTGNLSFTEPITERTQVMLSYQPSLNRDESLQDVFRFDEATASYSLIDTTLTNRYQNHILSNRVRGSYRFRGERYNANISLSWQHTAMDGEQTFPQLADIDQTWQNFLPDATFQYRFGRRSNIRLNYRTDTRTPSVRQLQDVIDNSNPLRMSTGNPELNQQFSHNLSLRLRHTNPEKGSSMSVFISFNYMEDYIGNRTYVAQSDTRLGEGIVLARGGRLVSPDNIGSATNFRTHLNRSMPVDLLSSNLSLSAGINFSQRPSFIDEERNITDNTRLSSGLNLSSNISERVDFRVSYNANYNIVENSIRPELNNNYYAGRASGVFNLMPWRGLVVASDINLRHYEGLGDDYNQSNIYWNGSLGYKFLENESAEFRITLFDILAQNDSISRSISEDYIEDYRSNVLTRYFIMTLSYNFRSFAGL